MVHLGQLTADKQQAGGRRATPSHAQHFCWEVLAELVGTGTEIAVSNCSKSCRTLRFALARQSQGTEHTHSRPNHSHQGKVWHSPAACVSGETCRKAGWSQKETKTRNCTKSHTLVSLGWQRWVLAYLWAAEQPAGQLLLPASLVHFSFPTAAIAFDYLQK